MHQRLSKIFTLLLLVAGTLFFINPNPFGNQPAVIADETYFLTSAVKALQDHTLPGWIADPSAAYYGGTLTYILFFLIGIGGLAAWLAGASTSQIVPWIAFHWGDLMHLGRIVNGLVVYVTLCWFGWQAIRFSKVTNNPSIKWFGFFVVALLCGGSIFIPLTHTSKVWPIYVALELIAGWLVISTEWKRRHSIPTNASRYFHALVFLALLSWSQVLFASLTFLWIIDALLLKHLTFQDIGRALKRPWIWMGVVVSALLNISFLQNFFRLSTQLTTLENLSGNVIVSAHPWLDRLLWPWKTLLLTHPLLFLLIIGTAFAVIRAKGKETKLVRLMWMHAAAVFLLFHVAMGFGLGFRYILPLTVMTVFIVSLSLMHPQRFRAILACACGLMAMATLAKTAWLFWTPSSVQHLERSVANASLPSDALLILRSGWFQFPVMNEASIQITEAATAQPVFRRFQVLHNTEDYRTRTVPYTVLADSSDPTVPTSTAWTSVWMIEDAPRPAACAMEHNPCIQINAPLDEMDAMGVTEGAGIVSLFRAPMIGRSYVLKRLPSPSP
jgi:hypothetical protein